MNVSTITQEENKFQVHVVNEIGTIHSTTNFYAVAKPIGNPQIFIVCDSDRNLDYGRSIEEAAKKAHDYAKNYARLEMARLGIPIQSLRDETSRAKESLLATA